jgi:hypothetical protein
MLMRDMRRKQLAERPMARGLVHIRLLSELSETIGAKTIQPGECAWIEWEPALALSKADPPKVEFIEYEQRLIDSTGHLTDIDDMPGFVCEKCLDEGKIVRFATPKAYAGHHVHHCENRKPRARKPPKEKPPKQPKPPRPKKEKKPWDRSKQVWDPRWKRRRTWTYGGTKRWPGEPEDSMDGVKLIQRVKWV